jgi:NAD(P)-dependent dehydrogenase (short-subunit alcohol dehydrogenase family)
MSPRSPLCWGATGGYAGLPMTPNPVPYTTAKAGVIGLTYRCGGRAGAVRHPGQCGVAGRL